MKQYENFTAIEQVKDMAKVQCHVAGVTWNNRQKSLAWLAREEKNGTKKNIDIILRREPNNEYDPNAIRVAAHGTRQTSYGTREFDGRYGDLGYLPAKLAATMAKVMDDKTWITINDWTTCGHLGSNSNLGLVLDLSWKA